MFYRLLLDLVGYRLVKEEETVEKKAHFFFYLKVAACFLSGKLRRRKNCYFGGKIDFFLLSE